MHCLKTGNLHNFGLQPPYPAFHGHLGVCHSLNNKSVSSPLLSKCAVLAEDVRSIPTLQELTSQRPSNDFHNYTVSADVKRHQRRGSPTPPKKASGQRSNFQKSKQGFSHHARSFPDDRQLTQLISDCRSPSELYDLCSVHSTQLNTIHVSAALVKLSKISDIKRRRQERQCSSKSRHSPDPRQYQGPASRSNKYTSPSSRLDLETGQDTRTSMLHCSLLLFQLVEDFSPLLEARAVANCLWAAAKILQTLHSIPLSDLSPNNRERSPGAHLPSSESQQSNPSGPRSWQYVIHGILPEEDPALSTPHRHRASSHTSGSHSSSHPQQVHGGGDQLLYAAQLRCLSVCQTLLDKASSFLHAFLPQHLSNTAIALSILSSILLNGGHQHEQVPRSGQAGPPAKTTVHNSTAAVSSTVEPTQVLMTPQQLVDTMSSIMHHSWPQLQQFNPQASANMIHSMAVIGFQPYEGWISDLLDAMEPKLLTFEPQHISMTLWSLAKLEYHPGDDWIVNAFTAASYKLPLSTPQALSNMLWALAKLHCSAVVSGLATAADDGIAVPPPPEECEPSLLDPAAVILSHDTPPPLSTSATPPAGTAHNPFLHPMTHQHNDSTPVSSTLSSTLSSVAAAVSDVVHLQPQLLRPLLSLMQEMLDQIPLFTSLDCSNCIWALATLKHAWSPACEMTTTMSLAGVGKSPPQNLGSEDEVSSNRHYRSGDGPNNEEEAVMNKDDGPFSDLFPSPSPILLDDTTSRATLIIADAIAALISRASDCRTSASPQHLCNTLWAASSLQGFIIISLRSKRGIVGSTSSTAESAIMKHKLTLIATELMRCMSDCTAQEISTAAVACARMGLLLPGREASAGVEKDVVDNMHNLPLHPFNNTPGHQQQGVVTRTTSRQVLAGGGTAGGAHHDDSTTGWWPCFWSASYRLIPECEAHHLSNMLWAAATAGKVPPLSWTKSVLQAAAAFAPPVSQQQSLFPSRHYGLSVQSMSILVWALTRLGVTRHLLIPLTMSSSSSRSISSASKKAGAHEREDSHNALLTLFQRVAISVREDAGPSQQQGASSWRRQPQALLMCLRAVTAAWQHYEGSCLQAARGRRPEDNEGGIITSSRGKEASHDEDSTSHHHSVEPVSLHHQQGLTGGTVLLEVTAALAAAFLSQQCLGQSSLRQLVSGVAVLTRLPPRVAAHCLTIYDQPSSVLTNMAFDGAGDSKGGGYKVPAARTSRPLLFPRQRVDYETQQDEGFPSTTHHLPLNAVDTATRRPSHTIMASDQMYYDQQQQEKHITSLLYEVERAALSRLPEAGVRECGVLLSSMLRLQYIPTSTFLSSCKQRAAAAAAASNSPEQSSVLQKGLQQPALNKYHASHPGKSSATQQSSAGSSVRSQVLAFQQFAADPQAVMRTCHRKSVAAAAAPPPNDDILSSPLIMTQLVGLTEVQDLITLIDKVSTWTKKKRKTKRPADIISKSRSDSKRGRQ
ncbi:hypothetical protein CEUSTIGMA_g8517.t1 [Chlamydomonas eustigma]|uniref:Uncharacterized protein n=1 Tax=Chlamydomonas eustigma TaxID=1157962 RepID=A0A250XDB7_9CHLO|nr:hypothetical protein CEUSTIGMA_g8517.t1 [Chlamydomonas eustigma]|eukprot:GAX81083.1 hypothetical protein CEUSTIGMA_g8517.t1 [Chlamydomonas eustigma]